MSVSGKLKPAAGGAALLTAMGAAGLAGDLSGEVSAQADAAVENAVQDEHPELAEAPGYGTKDGFAELREDLERLDAQIGAEEDAGGILGTIGESFAKFKERFFTSET
ncbi:hypothetical protein [Cribrihabitans pelagius]|uniref:hypothetical protein n=1 Tax=Cribrihabitans pelagius TaxID=1765746 RepID=UPI003B5A79C0